MKWRCLDSETKSRWLHVPPTYLKWLQCFVPRKAMEGVVHSVCMRLKKNTRQTNKLSTKQPRLLPAALRQHYGLIPWADICSNAAAMSPFSVVESTGFTDVLESWYTAGLLPAHGSPRRLYLPYATKEAPDWPFRKALFFEPITNSWTSRIQRDDLLLNS